MTATSPAPPAPHAGDAAPSGWVLRCLPLLAAGGLVLDLAAGHGRHARVLAAAGLRVEALDRDPAALAALRGIAGVRVTAADIEAEGAAWPYGTTRFDAIVVTNYLWRPVLHRLPDALAPGGVLVYETFRAGNERFGRPSNPAFLLRPGELLECARAAGLEVVAFESGGVELPRRAVVERLCAVRARAGAWVALPAALPAAPPAGVWPGGPGGLG